MSDSRRQAYRYAVQLPESPALLRTSEGEIEVQIVDESAGGFGVECDCLLTIREGEIAGFTTGAGQSIVRVVRVECDEEAKRTGVGLQRISELADEPSNSGNRGLLRKWLGEGAGTLSILLMFGLGLGLVMGLTSTGWLGGKKGVKTAASTSPEIPREPNKRAQALTKSFSNLDDLKSRQFVKTLGLTDGQQRKIDTVVEKLMLDLASVTVDRGARSPEGGSHIGLMMIRRAWLQVEGTLTDDQMVKWDAILDGQLQIPSDEHVGL